MERDGEGDGTPGRGGCDVGVGERGGSMTTSWTGTGDANAPLAPFDADLAMGEPVALGVGGGRTLVDADL